ncbi:hypothetical protein V8E53_000787 [Lactarius tabidus]
MPENAPGLYQRTSYPFESLPAALSHHRLPGPPYDGESTAPLHILPTQVHPNDGLASESQPPHDLAESRRIWILENAPSEYWRIYSSDAGAPVHFPFESLPAAFGQQHLPGPPYNVESAAPLQDLPTQVHPNDGLASASQLSHDLAESRRLWISENAPSDYRRVYSSDAGAPVYFPFESLPVAFGQQHLRGPLYNVESAAPLQVLPTHVHPNNGLAPESQLPQGLSESDRPWVSGNALSHHQRIYSSDAGAPVHFPFESLPAAFGQQHLPGPPYDVECAAPLQDFPTQVHPNDGLASESQPQHDLAESYRRWMLENEPGIYQRTSSPFEPLPAALDHQRLPGPSYDVESAVPLQVLLTQVHPNAPAFIREHLLRIPILPYTSSSNHCQLLLASNVYLVRHTTWKAQRSFKSGKAKYTPTMRLNLHPRCLGLRS